MTTPTGILDMRQALLLHPRIVRIDLLCAISLECLGSTEMITIVTFLDILHEVKLT